MYGLGSPWKILSTNGEYFLHSRPEWVQSVLARTPGYWILTELVPKSNVTSYSIKTTQPFTGYECLGITVISWPRNNPDSSSVANPWTMTTFRSLRTKALCAGSWLREYIKARIVECQSRCGLRFYKKATRNLSHGPKVPWLRYVISLLHHYQDHLIAKKRSRTDYTTIGGQEWFLLGLRK